ncbi:MAG: o-succinylbenzoate synthase [Candidatus Nanopelagicales bacterium]|nr:o-succinylbenzoate synthase [Candidatus Nanopelagicales bacterium]
MKLRERQLLPFRLPLRTPFRGLTVRRGCLISGTHGWGEFAPFDDYSDGQASRWLACALEQADGLWPQPVRRRVGVNAIIPAVEPDAAAAMALSSRCSTLKIKVGDAMGYRRVAAVREVAPTAALRVDVNGAWDLDTAITELRRLAPLVIEYAEQPVRSPADMRALRSAVDVPLAADESIRIDRLFDEVAGFADVAVLKVAPLGGVRATLDVAQRVGLPVVVSSALDSSLGLAASVAAACCLPDTPGDCGLGTGVLFAQDTAVPLLPTDASVDFPGYPPPADALEVAEQDLAEWSGRLERAAAHLTPPGQIG